jgi:hypothetical protein
VPQTLPAGLVALMHAASPCFISTTMPDGSPHLTHDDDTSHRKLRPSRAGANLSTGVTTIACDSIGAFTT